MLVTGGQRMRGRRAATAVDLVDQPFEGFPQRTLERENYQSQESREKYREEDVAVHGAFSLSCFWNPESPGKVPPRKVIIVA